jgi:iron complex outermembrane receptor protein
MKGETYGVEMVLDIHPQPWWRLSIAYSYLSMHLSLYSASTDQFSDHAESRSPENQLSIRSSMNFSDSIDCDLWWRYVDKLEDISIADYTTLDLRLAWRPVNQQHLEIAAVGRNLLEKSHREYKSELFIDPPAYMERSFFGKISWAF